MECSSNVHMTENTWRNCVFWRFSKHSEMIIQIMRTLAKCTWSIFLLAGEPLSWYILGNVLREEHLCSYDYLLGVKESRLCRDSLKHWQLFKSNPFQYDRPWEVYVSWCEFSEISWRDCFGLSAFLNASLQDFWEYGAHTQGFKKMMKFWCL